MSCRKWERWISDAQDGVLSPLRQQKLDVHLDACPECRGYAARLRALHAHAQAGEEDQVTPQEAVDMHARLMDRVHSAAGGNADPMPVPSGSGRRWAWFGTAAALTATTALLLLVLLRPGPDMQEQVIAFSLNEALEQAYSEVWSDDPELSRAFEALLASSLSGLLEEALVEIGPFHFDSLLLGADLTEEELRFLEEEIKKEIKS